MMNLTLKGTVSQDFLLLVFFQESVSPQPQSTAKSTLVLTTPAANLPPVSTTPVANFSTIFASVVDTGGNTGVNDTGGKFATGVNDAGGKLPP
jgi:hypothetical protein